MYSFKSVEIYSSIICKSICNSWLIPFLSTWCCLSSGTRFLISSNNTLISWRWGLCRMEAPQAVVPPEWLGSGWASSWISWSSWCVQSWCARERGLTSLLCLPCNLAALKERVESGGPEAGFVPQWVKVIWGGSLAVEAESSADQTVVAAPVIAAVAIKARTGAGRSTWLTRWRTGDAGRACSTSGHPGQEHINQGTQEKAHCDGHTESYDQRACEKRNTSNRTFYVCDAVCIDDQYIRIILQNFFTLKGL